jgi:hypothetical protein
VVRCQNLARFLGRVSEDHSAAKGRTARTSGPASAVPRRTINAPVYSQRQRADVAVIAVPGGNTTETVQHGVLARRSDLVEHSATIWVRRTRGNPPPKGRPIKGSADIQKSNEGIRTAAATEELVDNGLLAA